MIRKKKGQEGLTIIHIARWDQLLASSRWPRYGEALSSLGH